MDFLSQLPDADGKAVAALYREKHDWLLQDKKGFLRYREPLAALSGLRAGSCDFTSDTVRIGTPGDLQPGQEQQLMAALRNLMPWRKGPFRIFGIDIDSEWQSQRKWNRILPVLPDLQDKIIADIGCNNGYYLFRMAAHHPRLVLGFEPYVHHYYAFHTLNTFAGQSQLQVEPFGVEHLPLFPGCFDVIFLLGILYHRSSPLDTLRDCLTALKPGGALIVESQAIPGDEPVALFPDKTYAKVPGTWFVPTGTCLRYWLERSGFTAVQLFDAHPMSNLEQRKTGWMIFESYEDFLDKKNPERTIEGYPAPWRVYLKARKTGGEPATASSTGRPGGNRPPPPKL